MASSTLEVRSQTTPTLLRATRRATREERTSYYEFGHKFLPVEKMLKRLPHRKDRTCLHINVDRAEQKKTIQVSTKHQKSHKNMRKCGRNGREQEEVQPLTSRADDACRHSLQDGPYNARRCYELSFSETAASALVWEKFLLLWHVFERDEFFFHYRHSAQFMHTRIVCPLTYPTHSKRHLARNWIASACALHRSAQTLRVICR